MYKEYKKTKLGFYIWLGIHLFLCLFLIGFITLPLHLLSLIGLSKSKVVLGEKSVQIVQGRFFPKSSEIPYSKINNIQVESGMFTSGIKIFSGSDIGGITFDGLDNNSAEEIKRHVLDKI